MLNRGKSTLVNVMAIEFLKLKDEVYEGLEILRL